MIEYCKNCIRAKRKAGKILMWYCGKHRLYITEHTTADIYRKDSKPCPDYQEAK